MINPFFGFDPSVDGKTVVVDPKTPRPFKGTLSAVRFNGQLMTINASEQGIALGQ